MWQHLEWAQTSRKYIPAFLTVLQMTDFQKVGVFNFLMPCKCFLERLQVTHAHIKHKQVPKGRYFFLWEKAGLLKQKPYHWV